MKPLVLALLVAMPLVSTPTHAAPAPDDPALWLEDVQGARALEWVTAQDGTTKAALAGDPAFAPMRERFLGILNSTDKIPYVQKIGDRYYNFWRDAQHVRGLWRRTTLEQYRTRTPAWETVLDLDALSASEGANWVWEGADVLRPDETRCLVSLSKGGADASVVREFDLVSKAFVPGGFALPESKSSLSWIDRDHVYVALAADSTTLTTSGYPRVVKELRRGQPLEQASPVYECEASDVVCSAFRDHTPGFERDFVWRVITTYTNEAFLRRGGTLVKIEKPADAEMSVWREWLLLTLRTDWTLNGHTWPAGALLAARFDDWMAGRREPAALFTPTERRSLAGLSTTRHALLLNVLDNVRNRIDVVTPGPKGWTHAPIPGLPEFGTIDAGGVDDARSDDYFLTITDFLTPTSLYLGRVGGGAPEKLKQTPTYFDGTRHAVSQHEAVSKDGTRIPYFEVAPRDLKLDGSAPTMLTGYGGFEVSSTPYYSGIQGTGWLERGGVFVVANIRGGGEFGPRWHQAAVKQDRMRCYEDFIAVAEDLVKRKVTSPAHLGCIGGSNGGLLVGNMLTLRPDLFGAIVCQAPLLDMQRYHKLLAGASWMAEYGDPDDPAQWAFMEPWSPYQNLHTGVAYPPVLFTTSTRDDRVHPGHARRMAYRMQAMGYPALFYENVEGGHAGAADNPQVAFMSALAYTFAWRHLAAR